MDGTRIFWARSGRRPPGQESEKIDRSTCREAGASILQACDSWSETVGAYRFLRNPEVAWEGIQPPHWVRTQERMRAQRVVLCIQDTAKLDFNGQEIAGLGPLNYEARHGIYLHPTYAVTEIVSVHNFSASISPGIRLPTRRRCSNFAACWKITN